MSQEYIEITERTISEAITVACQKLAVPSERLEYEVIDPGKTGFLGIGARAARIRARVKQGMEESEEFDTSAIISDVLKGKGDKKKPLDQKGKNTSREDKKENRKNSAGPKKDAGKNVEKKPAAEKKIQKEGQKENREEKAVNVPKGQAAKAADVPAEEKKSAPGADAALRTESGKKDPSENYSERGSREKSRGHRRSRRYDREEREGRNPEQEKNGSLSLKRKSVVPVLTDEQIEEVKQRAETFLTDVFQAMDLEAEISSTYDKENGMLTIDMKGDNMGMLIGKRGQTLDSLQYLVSLVVNKGIEGYIHVKADTENYRERRKKTLENLAKNIASKVKRNHTSVALEPMNPYERRIIHSALQGDRYVTTYSEGEEPYRKVIVTMKEDR